MTHDTPPKQIWEDRMTDLTREQIEALLDGTTSRFLIRKYGGYYKPNCQGYTSSAILAGRYTEEDAVNYTHPNGPDGPRDGMTYVSEDAVTDEDFAAYAIMRQQRDDLAHQLLATMTALAEAQAAQAATVERCAEVPRKHAKHLQKNGLTAMSSDFDHIETDIRSLADPTGVKLLAEMRQREANLALHAANLADQLAEAQKREAGLREALNLADAALTEAEAILGGEYGDHYGPLCETMLYLRGRIAALSAAPTGEESNG